MKRRQFDPLAKVAYHAGWLEAYRQGRAVAPVCVEMDLTNRCNYDCPNCVWGAFITRDRAHVCREQALRQVRRCAEAGVKALVFTGGGEPLLNAAAAEAMVLARALGLDVGLFTNAVLVSDANAAALAGACSWIRVHLDAVTPELYQRRHGLPPAALERVRQGLRRLTAAATAADVGIGAVVNRETVGELEGLVRTARQTGCQFFQAKPDCELVAGAAYRDWWAEEVVPRLRALEGRYGTERFFVQYSTPDYGRPTAARRCHIHHLATAVNARGEYAYCKRLRDRSDWAAGNLGEAPLLDIVAGRRNLRLSEEVTPHNCGIACPYQGLNELLESVVNGDREAPSPDGGEVPRHVNFF